jgi:Zn-dependent metalloprotease
VAAGDYVRTFNDELDLGLSANDEYNVFNVSESDGLRHARMQQTYAGVPIFGADMVVHADDTTFLGFNGYVTKHLDGFDITTTVSESSAMDAAKDDLAGGVTLTYSDETTSLIILPGEKEGATLAWYVKFMNQRSGDIDTGIWNYFIDARSGEVLKKFNTLYTRRCRARPGRRRQEGAHLGGRARRRDGRRQVQMNSDRFETQDRKHGRQGHRGDAIDMFMDVRATTPTATPRSPST